MNINKLETLVVVPSDPIEAYEKQGLYFLKEYFNPGNLFRHVYALSPYETGERNAYGMNIVGVKEKLLKKKLKEIQPDAIRAYGGYWASDYICLNRIGNIPVVVSVHDTNPELLHASVKLADMVICMSKVVAQLVIRKGVDPKRIRILPNRIDIDVFRPINSSVIINQLKARFSHGKYILHVGRKTEQKNLDTLIRSLSQLDSQYSVIFIGAGNDLPYKKLAEELGVSNRCYWIEYIPNAELPSWYSWCDCMCTPSRWEGFGYVFIEAAGCGAPIVTSNIAPMNEYLKHNESAYLVDEFEKPEKLAQAIKNVCEDDLYRHVMQKNAIKVAQGFERSKIDKLETLLYHELCKMEPRKDAIELNGNVLKFKNKLNYRLRKVVKIINNKFVK